MNKPEVLKLMTYIFADYDTPLNNDKVDVWADQLANVDFEIGTKAAKALIRGAKQIFGLPKIGDLLAVIDEMKKNDADKMTGEEGWSIAIQLARSYGQERGGEASASIAQYPRLVHAIRTIGYRTICTTPERELPYLKRQFLELFEKVADREATEKRLGPITIEDHNTQDLRRIIGRLEQ